MQKKIETSVIIRDNLHKKTNKRRKQKKAPNCKKTKRTNKRESERKKIKYLFVSEIPKVSKKLTVPPNEFVSGQSQAGRKFLTTFHSKPIRRLDRN